MCPWGRQMPILSNAAPAASLVLPHARSARRHGILLGPTLLGLNEPGDSGFRGEKAAGNAARFELDALPVRVACAGGAPPEHAGTANGAALAEGGKRLAAWLKVRPWPSAISWASWLLIAAVVVMALPRVCSPADVAGRIAWHETMKPEQQSNEVSARTDADFDCQFSI